MSPVRRGPTEYTVECYSCGADGIAHEYSKREAVKTLKAKGWGIWDYALCPDCREVDP